MSRWRTREVASIDLRLLAAVVASDVPRWLLVGISPLVLSAYVEDRGFGEELAAWLSSGELMASAVASITVSGWVSRRSRRAAAGLGFALVVAGQLLSMARVDFLPLLAMRAMAGVGAGLAGAASTAAAAGTRDPERVLASAGFVVGLLGSLTVGPIGMAIAAFGAAGAFAAASLAALCALPLLTGLPEPRAMQPASGPNGTGHSSSLPALAVLVALGAFILGQNAVWGFTVRIGRSAGLSVEEVSWVLAITAVTGIAGAAAAAVLSTRRGRVLPLVTAIAATVAIVWVLVHSTTPALYIATNFAWAFLFAFTMPYLLGTLAALDPSGRWAAMGAGVAAVGGALGPASVGGMVEAQGYGSLGILMAAMGALSISFITPVLIRLDRGPAIETAERNPT